MSIADLNWLDWLVVLLLLLSAVNGTRRGLLLGTFDLFAAGLGLVVASVTERSVGDALVEVFPALAAGLAHVLAFLSLLIVVQVVVDATLGRLVVAIASALDRSLVGWLDRLLGLAPGVVRGLVTSALLLLPFALTPLIPALSQAIEQSRLSNQLVGAALEVMPAVEARLGLDLEGGLPSLVVAPPEAETPSVQPLPIGTIGSLEPDQAAEQRMLELLNAERGKAGLRALVADERLRQVAREHSREMFELNYFSHTSPVRGSPFDRMRAAGITFLVAGENLAYAPNVEMAHQGLMNSPGHRANILRSEFGRVGIGVIRSQAQGSMFTQDFSD